MELFSRLILMRHGESAWNKRNVFTGWVDVPLSRQGVEEALRSQQRLRSLPIDIVFTSTLMRAQMTAMLALLDHSSGKVPVIQHEGKQGEWSQVYGTAGQQLLPVFTAWQLNERMYGELQGCNKDETRAAFGDEQVQLWRRSYNIAPPGGESLEMTAARTLPYFHETIMPELKKGHHVLIAAHGNSLRSIIMAIDGLSRDEVVMLEIPLGEPIIYTFDGSSLVRSAV